MDVYRPINRPSLAVTVLMHGLNNPPKLMLPLARLLNQYGIAVVNGALRGHDTDMSVVKQTTAEHWKADVLQAAKRAHQISGGNLPVFYTGFSLGGLSGIYTAMQHPGLFEKALLFSPALALRPHTYLGRPLLAFLTPFSVFSIAPKRYSVNRWIPVQAYRNLFEMHDYLREKNFEGVRCQLPTRVVMRTSDELIHAEGIQQLIKQYGLDDWALISLPLRINSIQHMSVDLDKIGQQNMEVIEKVIEDFLGGRLASAK